MLFQKIIHLDIWKKSGRIYIELLTVVIFGWRGLDFLIYFLSGNMYFFYNQENRKERMYTRERMRGWLFFTEEERQRTEGGMQSVMDTPSRGVCVRACGVYVYVCEDVGVRV